MLRTARIENFLSVKRRGTGFAAPARQLTRAAVRTIVSVS